MKKESNIMNEVKKERKSNKMDRIKLKGKFCSQVLVKEQRNTSLYITKTKKREIRHTLKKRRKKKKSVNAKYL